MALKELQGSNTPEFYKVNISKTDSWKLYLLVDKQTRVQYLVNETVVYSWISTSMTVYVDANNKPILYEWDFPEE